jgi:hypothetical protein
VQIHFTFTWDGVCTHCAPPLQPWLKYNNLERASYTNIFTLIKFNFVISISIVILHLITRLFLLQLRVLSENADENIPSFANFSKEEINLYLICVTW